MKNKALRIISLLICLCLLTSCGSIRKAWGYFADTLMGRELRILIPYEKMEYSCPDFEKLEEKVDEARSQLESKAQRGDIERLLVDITNEYYNKAITARNLAYIEYCKDIRNEDNRNRYFDLYSKISELSLKLDLLYSDIYKSEHRYYFENTIFGEGFFDSYSVSADDSDSEYQMLLKKESELLQTYSEEMSKLSVELEGKHYTSAEIAGIADGELYSELTHAYYEKYNRILGEIYVELVKTRNRIAKKAGYESYIEYASERNLYRDYSTDEINTYLSAVREILSPIYREKIISGELSRILSSLPYCKPELTEQTADMVIPSLSDEIGDVYHEMKENKLYTFNVSDSMYYGSYQIYLPEYNTPYIFINGAGQLDDVLTVAHEFGHFISAYYNHGSVGSADESEVASQALELLSVKYAASVIDPSQAAVLQDYSRLSILSSLVECAQYTRFESMVYSDDSITLEKCNEYFAQTMKEYGIADKVSNGEDANEYWVFTSHLFEQPYYMVGYSTSASIAVQIALIDENNKSDIKTYIEFIKLASDGDTFFNHLAECNLIPPISEECIKGISGFFR